MTTTPDPRQPAWDAVFAYIRTLPRDTPHLSVVERNAIIWRGVNAALVALGHPDAETPTEPAGQVPEAHRKQVIDEAIAALDRVTRLAPDSKRAPGINFAIGVLMSHKTTPARATTEG